jgi:hypothetical protein
MSSNKRPAPKQTLEEERPAPLPLPVREGSRYLLRLFLLVEITGLLIVFLIIYLMFSILVW